MGAYGYSIEQTLIVDVEPDSTVRRAMNEINAGQFTFNFSFFQNIFLLELPTLLLSLN
jgi:hypothetical protein